MNIGMRLIGIAAVLGLAATITYGHAEHSAKLWNERGATNAMRASTLEMQHRRTGDAGLLDEIRKARMPGSERFKGRRYIAYGMGATAGLFLLVGLAVFRLPRPEPTKD